MGFDFSGSGSLRLLFEVVIWGCWRVLIRKGRWCLLVLGSLLVRARPARTFPGNSDFLLSQPSQYPSFLGRNVGRKIAFGKERKRAQLGQNLRENTNFVKIRPKCTPYSLKNKSLHRNPWRLWKQKVQNRCSVRAYARTRNVIESLFNDE